MEAFRIVLLASLIGAAMGGVLYAGVQQEKAANEAAPVVPMAELEPDEPETESLVLAVQEVPVPAELQNAEVQVLPAGVELEAESDALLVPTIDMAELPYDEPPESLEELARALAEEELHFGAGVSLGTVAIAPMNQRDILFEGGFVLGPLEILPGQSEPEVLIPTRRRARRPRVPPPPPMPRLHPNPGRHTILVARRMMAQNEAILGSCYRYLSEVYRRAGHHGWRNRRIVYRAGRDGPYADVGQIRPGDWLYIVNDPGRSPVGTHSVMFVGWSDASRRYARVISHPGWGRPHTGRESTYDVSMTYRIIRPILPG